jgi:hypothetical protein
MPRLARPLIRRRNFARHSHRTWMRSMALASAGWMAWWIYLFATHFTPELAPGFWVLTALTTLFAAPGLVLALWCVRSRIAWMFFALLPILANASLLALPWIARHYLPAAS